MWALEGPKIAGYVGCQANRPFGISGESLENPKCLDKLVEALDGRVIPASRLEQIAKKWRRLSLGIRRGPLPLGERPSFFVFGWSAILCRQLH